MNCEHCNTELVRRENEKPHDFDRRRFCNQTCMGQFRRSQLLKNIERFCKRCGKKLEPIEGQPAYMFRRRKACIPSCIPKREKAPMNTCKVCGQPAKRVFCSRSCREEHYGIKRPEIVERNTYHHFAVNIQHQYFGL